MAIQTIPIRKKGKRCRSDAHRTYFGSDGQHYFGSAGSLYRARNSAGPLYLEVSEIQIHIRMCYSNFNGIIQSIIDMDANVITFENSRSDEKLLSVFHDDFKYGAGISPGVYDINFQVWCRHQSRWETQLHRPWYQPVLLSSS